MVQFLNAFKTGFHEEKLALPSIKSNRWEILFQSAANHMSSKLNSTNLNFQIKDVYTFAVLSFHKNYVFRWTNSNFCLICVIEKHCCVNMRKMEFQFANLDYRNSMILFKDRSVKKETNQIELI